MLANPETEMGKVARLLGIEAGPERLARAVELSSADRMRRLEKDQGDKWVQTKDTRQDKQFVRNAASGDWRTILPEDSVQRIEGAWGDTMKTLGYELSAVAAHASAASERR
jgi:hypothetical protein